MVLNLINLQSIFRRNEISEHDRVLYIFHSIYFRQLLT